MIQTGFESKIKVQDIIENQIPSFILDESPKTSEFLKQYYISQEYPGGPIDIADNLDRYLNIDNLKPEVIVDNTTLTYDITKNSSSINVSSTKGFPNQYGIIKIDDEIITYSGPIKQNYIEKTCRIPDGSNIVYVSDIDSSLYIGRPFNIKSLNKELSIVSVSSTFITVSDTVIDTQSIFFSENIVKPNISISTETNIITGISTENLLVGNYIDEIENIIKPRTRIIGIGENSLTISPATINAGITTANLSFGTYKSSQIDYDQDGNYIFNTNSPQFNGCIRGFSGITQYEEDLNREELIFSTSTAEEHSNGSIVENLSSLFLKEFYKKLKYTFAPGLEDITLAENIDVGNFIKKAKNFYQSKGTDESIKILFKVIFGETSSIINLEDYLIKPSSANYIRREVIIAKVLSGDASKISGQTLVRSNDENTNASISTVESFIRKGKTFHKIDLYIGNTSDSSAIKGTFIITPNTKLVESASPGDSILTVDSTIGFPESGTLIIGNNRITYTGKTINQFIGCSNVNSINATSDIISEDTYFAYEDGDSSKKVELIILGVIQDLIEENSDFEVEEGDTLSVKSIGDKINNESKDKTYKEIFANSWIYNTSARYQIENNDNLKLYSTIDRSSLKVGDEVEILGRDSEVVLESNNGITYIKSIDFGNNTVEVENKPILLPGEKYDLRRKLNKSNQSGSSFPSKSLLSDVLNLYVDNEEYAFVASNSLPSEEKFNIKNYRHNIGFPIKSVTIDTLNYLTDKDFNNEYNSFTLLSSDPDLPFINGDKVYYSSEGPTLVGLDTGFYYIEKLNDKKFKLYSSNYTIESGNNLTFTVPQSGIGTHNFILSSQKDNELGIQAILRKFPLEKNIEDGSGVDTPPESTGMLINGVEIYNYKSKDFIHYGPIEKVNVLSSGENFDVINPPLLEISPGIGNTAKVQPIISGSFKKVYVDSQDYDIDNIISINISGGNGSGAVIEPILIKKSRDVIFDGRLISNGGGVSNTTNQILFLENHNFSDGERIVYNSQGNDSIILGDVLDNYNLPNNSIYYAKIDSARAIRLFNNRYDYESESNVVGIYTGTSGFHRFSTLSTKNQISYLKLLEEGEGYTNRKLIVNPAGISTTQNTIYFKDHGFNDGEIVEYDYEISPISGISTINKYRILKIDNDYFRICDSGIDGTITSNYDRSNYEYLNSAGSGYQYFKYPDISVSIKYNPVGFGTTSQEYLELIATPVVKGSISGIYVYESGTGYGSTVLNYKKNPNIAVKNGKFAELSPVIINGSIQSVIVSYTGIEYYSVPDLIVLGSGTGAELRSVIQDGKIIEVKVINPGIGYSQDTTIQVIPSGRNLVTDFEIRKLRVNNNIRFSSGEVLLEGRDKLQYSILKYFDELSDSFLEEEKKGSEIIGWCYDGNPIYGPYGHSDPNDRNSEIKQLKSSYTLDISNVFDRPNGFSEGFFVEDYKFNSGNDLDEYNGRYEKNNDFPNGVYAYHATIDEFPYFIGNKYKSKLILDYKLDQSLELNNLNLLRNTLPYKISEKNASYDFIDEITETFEQKVEVVSVTDGGIESLSIENSGDGYKIGDKLIFDNTNTSGNGLDVEVSSIKGKDIISLETSSSLNNNSIFVWESSDKIKVSILPYHNFKDLDYVNISGFGSSPFLNGTYRISVPKYENGRCLSTITSASLGFTTEIYVSPIPNQISVGSSIIIGTETLSILGVYREQNILRVERGSTGVSHTVGTAVTYLSNYFTFSKSLDQFSSKLNDIVFFNPKESIGVSTLNGVGYNTSFTFGNNSITRSIPSKGIYIDNHPFLTNQSVIFTTNGSPIGYSTDGLIPFLPLPQNLFVVNKNKNLIGLKTSLNGEEVFFHTNGIDNDKYSIQSNYPQVLGNVEKNEVIVSVSTSHELTTGDLISLNVKPNLNVGIGTFTSVKILYNSKIKSIVVNPIEFTSLGINTITNQITIPNHRLETGDKILYENYEFGEYFVYKVNKDKISLCETYYDTQKNLPIIVGFASTGASSQSITLINPPIKVIKNNNLVFDLSDSSLSGYEFKIFTDLNFNHEFETTKKPSTFNVSNVGIVGISTNASLTIQYDSSIPENLYYNLEKSGNIANSDKDVINYNKISYINSIYNGSYNVIGIGTTTFSINLEKLPEKLSYASTECSVLEYSTKSSLATGPVNSLNILSSGSGYKKLPFFKSTNSISGKDLLVIPKSNTIGSIKELRTINSRFAYPSDKTLRPKVFASPIIKVKDSNTIDQISIISGGSGYVSPPNFVLVNSENRDIVTSGLIEFNITGSSITSTEIIAEPKGLPDEKVELYTINNNNGVSIEKVESVNATTFDCYISTPNVFGISEFRDAPFSDGDEVFVEGIQKFGSSGDGFNSSDYGYKFFKVIDYDNTSINDRVRISVSGLTTNTGIPKTIQDYIGVLINKNDYPVFEVTKKISNFVVGEKLSSNGISRDLEVVESVSNYLKIIGTYNLSVGETIIGNESGNKATIVSLKENNGVFNIGYSNLKNIGWENEIGKLSEDYQVIANNDYYQNLSYSIKSSVSYKDQQSPIESLVHISGMKNFADTQVLQNANGGVVNNDEFSSFIYDIIDEKRVDTINNFDRVIDQDVIQGKSKFLKLQSEKLTNYTELKSLDVLSIDDISNQFSSIESEVTEFLSIEEVDDQSYYNFLIRIVNPEKNEEIQLTDITILSNGSETFIVENESLTGIGSTSYHLNNDTFGTFDLYTNEYEETFLRFYPNDPFDSDYDLKIIRQVFDSSSSGLGAESIGFVKLTGSTAFDNADVGIGTTTIISVDSNNFDALYINSHAINLSTLESDYVRLYVVGIGTSTYTSEYYIDGYNQRSFTGNQIGTFYANIDDSGILHVFHENNTPNQIRIKSNIVGFGNTLSGIGTYRYSVFGQDDGQERSAIYESGFTDTSSGLSTSILTFNKNLFNASKSVIQISEGYKKALHQVMIIYNENDVYIQQLPFLTVSGENEYISEFDGSSGLGTFGGSISGNDVILSFYPDSSESVDIKIFSKILYKDLDIINEPPDLSYGTVIERIDEKFYNGINLDRINKTNFVLRSNKIPIFSKTFNPNRTSELNPSTGVFTIPNHFFVTGEELIYTPNSTIEEVGISSIETGSGPLPSRVYAYKVSDDKFKIALTKESADAGIGTTFTSLGEGNSHRFTMAKRNSKCIITIDDLIQYPLTYTKITHQLNGNVNGEVGINTDIISLSGISSINPKDTLLVDDEYMGVINVGLGTTNLGPITNSGNLNLVKVDRGFVGSYISTHTDSSLVRLYKGAFNIVDDEIHFAEPPRGNPQINKTKYNLDFETSSFTGRAFLKSGYENNKIYDDISDEFSGINSSFTLKVGGANTTGIGTEGSNGLIFINGVYQSPKTDNNPNIFNYEILEDVDLGLSTVRFSGITRPDDPLEYVISEYDVNANALPRGGIIVSYGSTTGLGFAPLVGASVTAVVGAGGSIVSVGLGTTDNLGSGYNGLTPIGVFVYEENHVGTAATIEVSNIGVGGTLSFSVVGPGTGYNNPKIFVSDPSYENLPIIGVSRLGIGNTTETGVGLLMDVKVGGSTGIGSTYFEVTDFKFSRTGYGFRRGDVFKPVGLVTDASLLSPLSDFTITVVDTYTDSFAAWDFGEIDYIDSIKQFQDGIRVRFPLIYNGELLSFEPENNSSIQRNINNVLVIFINGIIQEPKINYIFEGGTSFVFTTPPLPEDNIDIYFYKGVDGVDSVTVDDIFPTIKYGDDVQVLSINSNQNTISQEERTVYNLAFSDKFETNLYFGQGIDETVYKPLSWTKQKVDKKINGEFISKSRDTLEPLIFPTAKIIKNISTTDNEIFLDSIELFEYEDGVFGEDNNEFTDKTNAGFDALIIDNTNPVSAAFTCSIGFGGTVIGITTLNVGSGYAADQSTISLKFTNPPELGIGIGTTASAEATIINGSVSSVSITNPGFGYAVEPKIFAETPNYNIEKITGFSVINGFSGIVTGITTSNGIGTALALVFNIYHDVNDNYFSGISTGYPIYIYDTQIGNGVVSIDESDSESVGIGTTFLDNVYYVSDWSNNAEIAIITCNVKSDSNIIGIETTGSIENPVGKYSWGRLYVGTRSENPISINVSGNIVSGLSTYPTIQRRNFGIRKTGALPKIVL